jgi:hypothetical protein
MIKNQLLNVSFDDMVMEKNHRKMLLESLSIELFSLKEQEKTSSKLMVSHLSTLYKFHRLKRKLYLNHISIFSLSLRNTKRFMKPKVK